MKIKAVDIAERLGISKATVSLALNGKPGVGEETRSRILQCKEEMEQQLNATFFEKDSEPAKEPRPAARMSGQMIKILMFDRKLGIVCDPALNIWTGMLRMFDEEARKQGYHIGITYVSEDEDEIARVVEECNREEVAGVLLYGTEMQKGDFDKGFRLIRKPMLVYDYDAGSRYHNVIIDNENAVMNAVEFLYSRGCRSIYYMSKWPTIYNFEFRRIGFLAGCYRTGLDSNACPRIEVGSTVEDICEFMRQWVRENKLPDAMIMENYQVSIGIMKAFHEMGIKVPEDVSLIGVDEVPSYMTAGVELDCIRVSHEERGRVAMKMLLDEIHNPEKVKLRVAARSQLLLRDSVK